MSTPEGGTYEIEGSVEVSGTVELTPTDQPVVPPDPGPGTPKYSFRAVLDIGDKTAWPQLPYCVLDWDDPAAKLGISHVILPLCEVSVADALQAKGLRSGGWYTGMWNNSSKTWSSNFDTKAEVQAAVNKIKGHPANADHYYYVADEPVYSSQFVTALANKLAWIREADPAAVCVMADYDSHGSGSQFLKWARETTIDEVWISVYGVRGTSANRGQPGAYDLSILDGELAAAKAAKAARSSLGFKGYVGLHNDTYSSGFGGDPAYSGTNARLPTAAQIGEQVDHFRSSPDIDGLIGFAYAPNPEQASGSPPNKWPGWVRGGWGEQNFVPRDELLDEWAKQVLRP